MSEFNWKTEYNIGNAMVDAQHQNLFDLANQIVDATNSATLTRLFMLFYQHIREHFEAEEQLMKQNAYPDYERHVAIHNQMLDRLIAITETIHAGTWTLADIKAFVASWVLVHILEEDKLLGEYLTSLTSLSR